MMQIRPFFFRSATLFSFFLLSSTLPQRRIDPTQKKASLDTPRYVPPERRSNAVPKNIPDNKYVPPLNGNSTFNVVFDQVKGWVQFLDLDGSGGSLVAALLDAHPRVMIPNGFNLIKEVDNHTKTSLFEAIYRRSRRPESRYDYEVEGEWTGLAEEATPYFLGTKQDPTNVDIVVSYFDYFQDESEREAVVQLDKFKYLYKISETPVNIIHVVRNPYDGIATLAIKKYFSTRFGTNWAKELFTIDFFNNIELGQVKPLNSQLTKIAYWIFPYFEKLQAVQQLSNLIKENEKYTDKLRIIHFDSAALISEPYATLSDFCSKLGIQCTEKYLAACTNQIPSKYAFAFRPGDNFARLYIEWTREQVCQVMTEMKKIEFLQHYLTDVNPRQLELNGNSKPVMCQFQCFPGSYPCPCANYTSSEFLGKPPQPETTLVPPSREPEEPSWDTCLPLYHSPNAPVTWRPKETPFH